jgi:hypothetical protein
MVNAGMLAWWIDPLYFVAMVLAIAVLIVLWLAIAFYKWR